MTPFVMEITGNDMTITSNQPTPSYRMQTVTGGYCQICEGSLVISWETLFIDNERTEGSRRFRVTVEDITEANE